MKALESIVIIEGDKAEFHNINEKSLNKIVQTLKNNSK